MPSEPLLVSPIARALKLLDKVENEKNPLVQRYLIVQARNLLAEALDHR